MSRTLFVYIFRDLLRIFMLTSGALAGIMSFGGLLRPLTEHGLDAGQVAKVLTYFMPAMTTYSLPIAALFATTMVYGRLAADNELTACRAAGVSYLSISMPAFVLGLIVAIVSLVFLCFVVPNFSMKVERVIYSNLANLVATEIERTRQIDFEDQTIYAERAVVSPPAPDRPDEQVVTLESVMVTTYDQPDKKDPRLQIPNSFYLAKAATIFIDRGGSNDDEYSIEVLLEGGTMFPRQFTSAYEGGISETHIGPITRPSPIGEKTEFMDIRRLHELARDETKSRKVRDVLRDLIRAEQSAVFLQSVRDDLNGRGVYRFDAGGDEVYELRRAPGAEPAVIRRGELIVPSARLAREKAAVVALAAESRELRLKARPAAGEEQLVVDLNLHAAVVTQGGETTERGGFQQTFQMPMPPDIGAIARRQPQHYLNHKSVSKADQNRLRRELIRLRNGVESELHGRASFAVSCLILVIVGCYLGMMFKSGNFLTAFAVSVVPALLCIALVVTGQHTAESVPWSLDNFQNPLKLGLALIWSGNVAVLVIAVVLMGKMQRQ